MMSIKQQPINTRDDLKRTASATSTKEEIPLKKRKLNAGSTSDEDIFHEQIYKSYIKSALDSLETKQNHVAIDKLTSQINLPSSSLESLSANSLSVVLQNISKEISRVDNKHCQNLILSLINLKVTKYKDDYQFIKSYQLFITVLLSGVPKWWNEVSQKIVSDFVYEDIECHHELLQKILNIIPTSINILQRRLSELYPNKHNKKKELINYIKNLLRLNQYCAELRFHNWCTIIENCIKLDVELQNELDELDEIDSDNEEQESGDEIEDDEVDSDSESEDDLSDYELESEDENNDDTNLPITVKTVSNLSSKLDSIIVILLKATTITERDLSSGDGVELYNIMSSLFKSHILPTHLTRSIQYLVFNLASSHAQLMDSFLYLLIEVSFQQKEILTNRIKSMQYISSFIARCKNLPRDKLIFVTSFLISWMDRFIQEREIEVETVGASNLLERFKLFYHCFQALIYIFCFKYKELKKNEDNGEWECGIDRFFQKTIITKFNPLKYCNENVVKIFAELSAKENLCYCFSILDKIKRENYGLNHQQMNVNELNGYFPFDPLTLKHSRKLIKDNYLEWNGDNIDDDDEEEEEIAMNE